MPTMAQYAFGVFLALHGLVHFWYVVLSRGWVEYEEAMGWNGRSWLLSGTFDEGTVLVASAVLSTIVLVAMWDGRATQLVEKGALGVLIDAGLLVWLLVLS